MKLQLFLFCIKAVIFLVLLFAIDRIVGVAFVAMKDIGLKKNPENIWLKTPFAVERVNSDIIIIGSSKASHHYIPQMISDSLHMTVYNCGQDGCFFLYQNCIINMLLDRYKPKIIIWDIQPSSFINNTAKEYQNIRYLSPYYSENEWANKYINSESEKMPLKMQSRMFAYNSKILNYLFPLVVGWSKSNTDNGYIPLFNEEDKYPEKRECKESNVQYERNNKYLSLLSATLKRCGDKEVVIKLFISPKYAFESDIYREVIKDISNVAINNYAHCYNYHSLFSNDSKLFKDVEHLNDNGAKKYTAFVVSDLKN